MSLSEKAALTSLVAIGLVLNTIGCVFVMEAPGEEYNLGRMAFWQSLRSLRSNANPNLSLWTFYIAIAPLSNRCVLFPQSHKVVRQGCGENS